ncbi:kinase-like domain-containing protein [Gorgonomyces haynaldii]|nr:kinase-like domain-containing protein [Gorgonomyces haynaldii]
MSDCETILKLHDQLKPGVISKDTTNCCLMVGIACIPGTQNVSTVIWNGVNCTGTLTEDIGQLKSLTNLRLEMNSISGPIPKSIAALPKLETLLLYQNQLSGSLPDFTNATILMTLDIHSNQLTGQLSGMPKTLVSLDLSSNQLSGSVSPLSGLQSLQKLILSRNSFSGSFDIVLPHLRQLFIEGTQLSGPLAYSDSNVPPLDCNDSKCCAMDNLCSSVSVLQQKCSILQCTTSGPSLTPVIAGVAIGVFLILGAFAYLAFSRRTNKTQDIPLQTLSQSAASTRTTKTDSSLETAVQELLIDPSQLVYGPILGRGGFGVVYKGTFNGETVAIKKLNQVALSRGVVDALLKEASIMKQLFHPRIVTVYGVGEDQGQWLLVMEYLQGKSLYEYIQNEHPLTQSERLRVAADISVAMAYLHHKRIIHRDLKSSNVLLDRHLRPKVSDFGLSLIRTETSSKVETSMAGTIHYLGPECLGLTPLYSESSDVYAFAIILWELLVWNRPYPGVGSAEIRAQVRDGQRMSIPDHVPQILKDLIEECWHQDHTKRPRFQHINKTLNAIRLELYGEYPTDSSIDFSSDPPSSPRPYHSHDPQSSRNIYSPNVPPPNLSSHDLSSYNLSPRHLPSPNVSLHNLPSPNMSSHNLSSHNLSSRSYPSSSSSNLNRPSTSRAYIPSPSIGTSS